MRRTMRRVRMLSVFVVMGAVVAACFAMPRDSTNTIKMVDKQDLVIGTSASPNDPVFWYWHTNSTITENGKDIIVNGADIYAIGGYAVNAGDVGFLATKWDTSGQFKWRRELNQLTLSDPNGGVERAWEGWCNGSGEVYIGGHGTALAMVNSSGTITSLNVSSYDMYTDIDVCGEYIYVGGRINGAPQKEGYLAKFTLDGIPVWKKIYSVEASKLPSIEDIEVVGDTIIGIESLISSPSETCLVTWNATTGAVLTNVSLGMFRSFEMELVEDVIYIVGFNASGNQAAVLLETRVNGTTEWLRTWTAGSHIDLRDLHVVGDSIYVCGDIEYGAEPQGQQGYVAKWTTSGTQLWNYTWGTNGDDYATGIAVDAKGLYLTGQHPDSGGYDDLFVMKLRLDGKVPAPSIGKNVSGPPLSGDSVLFTAGGTFGDGPSTCAWDFDDGSSNVTGTTAAHAFASGGAYNVTLTVVDADNSTAVASLLVVVVQDVAPAASFTASSTAPSTGEAVRFTYTGTLGNGPGTFLWTFGAGGPTSTEQDATFTFAAAGTYNVTLVVTDGDGDAGTTSLLITARPPGVDAGVIAGSVIGASAAMGLAITWHVKRAKRPRAPPMPPS